MSSPTILNYDTFAQWRTKINTISSNLDSLGDDIGDLTDLETTDKTSIVYSINEVNSKTTADIADSEDKRYCTDAQKTVINNTSGTNTGDQDLSGLVPNSRTINSKELSSNITLSTADIADSEDKRYCSDAQKTVINNTSGTNTGDSATPAETTTSIGTLINGATDKTTPVDADMIGLMDSEASNVIKKLSWSSIKTVFNSLYAVLSGVSGGQTLKGGTGANDNLTLVSTHHATKGKILFGTSGYDESSNKLGVGNSTPDQVLTITGNATATGFICSKFTSKILTNGLNSDIAITSSFVRFTGPDNSFSIGGFSTPIDGCNLTVYNTTANAMTIVSEDASSTAANRIKTLTSADVVLSARTSSASFIYDSTDSRWILLGTN